MTTPDRPTTDADSEAWWSSIQDGTLHVNACGSCDRKSLYPRAFCPHCWSEDVTLIPASGDATLYTWTVVHQNGAPFDALTPYVLAMVDLSEGPRVMTTVENCAVDALEAGMALTLDFRHDDDGFVVPVFQPATSATSATEGN